jgi:RND family efflux transporter MFP subunit
MTGSKRLLLMRLFAAASVLSLVGCGPEAGNAGKPVTLVEATTVQFVPHARQQVLTGAIQARAQTPAAFLISGRLTELGVTVGDRVAKGEVLARMSPAEQQADVEAAEAGLVAAQSRLTQTRSTLDRQESLWSQGLTTRSSLDSARTAWETATSTEESAKAQLDLAREALGYTELLASTDGVVIRKLAEVDEIVQAGSPVYMIAEDGPRTAVINVQETAIAGWDAERPVTVAPISSPQSTTVGKVSEIAPALDATGTVQVKVAIDKDLPLGTAVSVVLEAPAEDRVVLPAQALGQNLGAPAVWVVSADQTVNQKPVSVESYETGSVVIADGLEAGDVVVTAGTQFLSPGLKVDVQEAPRS